MNECNCRFCVTLVTIYITSLNIQDFSCLPTRGIFSVLYVPTVTGFNWLTVFVMEASWKKTLKLQVTFTRKLKDFKELRNTLDSLAY